MDEQDKVIGGAGPALAAHSKDGAAPGPTPASSAMGNEARADAGPYAETVRGLADQARDGVERVKASVRETAGTVREAAGSARESLSGQGGRAAEQAGEFVREQPLAALAITGAVCFALGVLLGRR